MSTLVTIRQTTTTTTTTTMNTNNGDNDGQTPVRSYGITGPISTKGPDPQDRIATENLEETLRSYDYFESDAELAHRVDVMAKLNALVRKWIRDVSLAKNVPPEIVDTVGGRVHTFGSYRLGVHSKGNIRKQLEKIISINSILNFFFVLKR
jgi:poly(A) polymerase